MGFVDAPAVSVRRLSKRFGATIAVDELDLDIPTRSFYGIVGPNGAGKTTTISMVTGLLTPDAGTVHIHGVNLWDDPDRAKPMLGVLPDGLRTFDRLTGAELISYAGLLRGVDPTTVKSRRDDLLAALDLEESSRILVTDFSAGMMKKITLACALIHAPSVLVLDEPFEAVDPVSAGAIRRILADFAASGGTVVMSSHVMALVERVCDHVAILGKGKVLAQGTLDDVRKGMDLEDRFVELVGILADERELPWLRQS
jgi:ABC-2 type transport system ATP-binding protein